MTKTKPVETPVIGFEEAKAILKVAYLLAATDGDICEQEQAKFRALMRQLFGDRYASPEVMAYLVEVSEDARKLIALRAFYPDDKEIVKAFSEIASPSAARIIADVRVVRCAFAIWISICCADNDYSRVERAAVKELQQLLNPGNALNMIKSVTAVGASVLGFSPVVKALVDGYASKKKAANFGVITDRFLVDVEKRVKSIGELYAKMEAATDSDVRQNYKDMYDFEVENLTEFLTSK